MRRKSARLSDYASTRTPFLVDAVHIHEPLGYVKGLTREKGYGLFATRRFQVGDTVIVGAPVHPAQGNGVHAVQTGIDEFGYEEGMGTLVNHSCDPNCGIRLVDADSNAFDLVARRPIDRGEEISVDYAMRNYVIEFFPRHCLCGAAICRRHVTGWKDLPEDRRIAYADSIAPFLLALDAVAARQL